MSEYRLENCFQLDLKEILRGGRAYISYRGVAARTTLWIREHPEPLLVDDGAVLLVLQEDGHVDDVLGGPPRRLHEPGDVAKQRNGLLAWVRRRHGGVGIAPRDAGGKHHVANLGANRNQHIPACPGPQDDR